MKRLGIILTAISAAVALQAQVPQKTAATNPTLRQELLSRAEQDQAIRNELISKGMDQPDKSILARMQTIDSENTRRMTEIIKQYGWPGPELVGEDATDAAFLLVQHADHEFQKQVLPLVKLAYESHKLSGQNYALLLDRVLVSDGKPQVYGTQAKPVGFWTGHEPVLHPIEDEANVDKRRAAVGLPPLADYLQFLKKMYFPKDE
jgi:hypothetical protein